MRKILLPLLLIVLSVKVMSQVSMVEKLSDQIKNHPQQDTARVNLLNQMIILNALPAREIEVLAKESLAISRKAGYTTGEGYALLGLGTINTALGNYDVSARYLQQADSIANTTVDEELGIYVLAQHARIKTLTGASKDGLADYLRAEQAAMKTGNKQLLSYCQRIIAGTYQTSFSNFPKSMEYILKAIDNAEDADCANCLAGAYSNLAALYNLIGDQPNALIYYKKAAEINERVGNKQTEATLTNNIGERYRLMGKYPEAIASYKKAITAGPTPYNTELNESNIADVYVRMDSLNAAFYYLFKSLAVARQLEDKEGIAWIDGIFSRAYLKKKMPDSAIYHALRGLKASEETGTIEFMRDNAGALTDAYAYKKDFEKAYGYHVLYIRYRDSMLNAAITNKTALLQYNYDLERKQSEITSLNQQKKIQQNFLISALIVLILIVITAILLLRNNRQKQKANLLLKKQKQEIDKKADELTVQKANVELLGEIGRKITVSLSVETIISTVYDNVNLLMDANIFGIGIYNETLEQIEFPATYEEGQALPFYVNSIHDRNRFAVLCFKDAKEIVIGNLDKEYLLHIQEVLTPHESKSPVSLIYLPLIVKEKKLGVITVQSFQQNAYSDYHLFMLRNIATYTAIAIENAESFETLNETVSTLRSTQSQLIQAEKMASLGELTAGIAHEIQNPLNFVNNFSEVNTELIDELEQETGNGNLNEIKLIAKDLRRNLEKINHHGKRADAIVKSMLEHSRAGSGQKELTDINKLADEYLRLAYHGLRAKDKTFNVNIKTEFDESIGRIKIVSQDIGRMLLNLFNNGFYATSQKQKTQSNGYEPSVLVRTKKLNGVIEIQVKDNGNGIPQNIADKIFQPFFTTKPTGLGTGLGLSLAYDIIKAHGGEITVKSEAGEGSTFTINLPF
ncbi:MAG TPA: ATP-binding protein [Parafilimonas sp.]|nr:ATP-binding protein [Parafilimonas sp.]